MVKPKSKRRTEPFQVTGVGSVPMLYVEAWGVYEAYRRLGFQDDDIKMEVMDNLDTGTVRKNVLHVTLSAQGKEFVYSLWEIDRSFEDAQKLILDLKTAIYEEKVSLKEGDAMYRATRVGALDGLVFKELTFRMIDKGFEIPALMN